MLPARAEWNGVPDGGPYTRTMTSERAQAYGRVVAAIDAFGPTKLLDSEIARIRAAADALFFADELAPAASAALSDVTELHHHLVESGRWLEETADRLLDDLVACGPVAPVA
jgi:hypothetical protein